MRIAGPGGPSSIRWMRIAIAAIAAIEIATAAAVLSVGVGDHSSRELAAFELALAAGLLTVAFKPGRASALVPALGVGAVLVSASAVIELVGGTTRWFAESHHLLEIGAAGLVATIAHRYISVARSATARPVRS